MPAPLPSAVDAALQLFIVGELLFPTATGPLLLPSAPLEEEAGEWSSPVRSLLLLLPLDPVAFDEEAPMCPDVSALDSLPLVALLSRLFVAPDPDEAVVVDVVVVAVGFAD